MQQRAPGFPKNTLNPLFGVSLRSPLGATRARIVEKCAFPWKAFLKDRTVRIGRQQPVPNLAQPSLLTRLAITVFGVSFGSSMECRRIFGGGCFFDRGCVCGARVWDPLMMDSLGLVIIGVEMLCLWLCLFAWGVLMVGAGLLLFC